MSDDANAAPATADDSSPQREASLDQSTQAGPSKPSTPVAANPAEEEKPATPAAAPESGEAVEPTPKPETPAAAEAEGAKNEESAESPPKPASKAASPTPGSKPASPKPASKPASPTETPKPASKPASPAPASKPASPKPGSKPASPTEASKPASKAASPAPASKPTSPTEASKAASPTEVSKPASKPASPEQAAPDKPPTPAGSKPGSKAGSRSGSRAASRAGSKPPTPTGSRPPSAKEVPKPESPPTNKPPTPKPVTPPAPPATVSVPPPPPPMAPGPAAPTPDNKSSNALNMSWSFGLNRHVPVVNLTDEQRKSVMYACAHTGVIYDFEANKQFLLQGHSNVISCTCVSADKRWLATGDRGDDSLIIVWDTYTNTPVRTIFDAHPDGGVIAMAMTPDAKYLATIGAGEKQVLAIWDWTVEGETPICTAELNPSFGQQSYVLFNPEDTSQLVTNSDSQVIFYTWRGGQLKYFAPPLSDEDFNKPVGKFSQSVFQGNTTRALTATSFGNLVVWDTNKPIMKAGGGASTPDKKALKLVKLQDRGLSVLTTTERFDKQYIVAGDVLGHIKFFDQTLKLMNWYQDFELGPVNSLSFAHWPQFDMQATANSDYPPDATISAKQFAIKDFVVGTTNAVYAQVTTDGTNVEVIQRDHDAAVHALAAHPSRPYLAVGSYSGLLKVWDYSVKQAVISRRFDRGLMIRCCTFNHDGTLLAVGFTNGSVRILDGLSLKDTIDQPFQYARDAITHVAFAHDGSYLASADAEYTVTLYRAQFTNKETPWLYLGRYRAHYKLIHDVLFGVHLDSDKPRLLTLGEDRFLVEYDLENSTEENLRVLSSDRIEQSSIPMCAAWYPAVTKESFIVTANDQFKFKLYNSTTKMCRKTLLGPTYGSPIQKIVILPSKDPLAPRQFLAYITNDKVGLHILPLDGNPHNAMALIAHPQGVVNVACSNDGKYLFTAGGVDATVHMWDINTMALEAQSALGGEDLIPFYGLLDGGRDGELFKEMEDYFYYAQIRSQGVDTTDNRRITTKIPLSEIPYVMRAMGYYPSEQEIDEMLNEIKYSNYVESGQYATDIDLGEFIRLYINHRPAFGLQPEKLLQAFEMLGYPVSGDYAIDRGDLLDILLTKGEHMSEFELAEYLTTLLGYNEEGGSSEQQEFDPSSAGDIIDENLPLEVTAGMFSQELLGFSMYSDMIGGEALSERDTSRLEEMA